MAQKPLRRGDPKAALEAGQSDHSLLRRFRLGSEDAATALYFRYANRLRALAESKFPTKLARRVDAEDIVQSVFRSFFQHAKRGLYDVPAGEELWKILLVIALNKIRSQMIFHRAAKRDVRRVASSDESVESSLETPDDSAYSFLQIVVDEALEKLPAQHKRMVELRIQGYEVAQIAEETGRSKRTVEPILQESRNKLGEIFREA
jgi:RNA polymerase sigma-70 factor (ECF subfamily)